MAFLKRSRLVRRLELRTNPRVRLHSNVLETISTYRPEITLFPALRVIEWCILDGKGAQLPLLLSLVGNQLTGISITVLDQREVAEKILQGMTAILSSRTRHCRALQLRFSNMSNSHPALPSTISALSSLVSPMFSLTTISCKNVALNPNAIASLARLELRHVSLRLPDNATWPHISDIVPFSALTYISFHATIEAYVAFSKAMVLPTIRKLDLSIVGEPTSHLIPELFRSIRRQFSPNVFDDLSIRPADPPQREAAERSAAVIRPDDLRPLLELAVVSRLNLNLECHYAMDDAFIYDMAKAWPKLYEVYLAQEKHCVHDSLPSLTALAHLAAYSEDLDNFGLCVDASGWSGNIETEEGERVDGAGPEIHYYGDLHPIKRPSTSNVVVWNVGSSSPIRDPEHVAFFLATIFPDLDEVSAGTYAGGDGDLTEGWKEVDRYLPMFNRLRRDWSDARAYQAMPEEYEDD